MDPAMSIMGDSKIALRVKVDRFGKEESHDSDSASSLFIFLLDYKTPSFCYTQVSQKAMTLWQCASMNNRSLKVRQLDETN